MGVHDYIYRYIKIINDNRASDESYVPYSVITILPNKKLLLIDSLFPVFGVKMFTNPYIFPILLKREEL